MGTLLRLADARILLWLNHALAQHPRLYQLGLFMTDEGADLMTLATLAWLWFWRGRPEQTIDGSSGGASGPHPPRTRRESRARLIVFAAAGMACYVSARLIAFTLDVERPFASYLPVRGTPGAFDGLRTFGSFPSDHAALLGALPVALFWWNRRVAWGWSVLALLLIVVRVAVGFHYPVDMLAGLALGAAFGGAAMWLFDHLELVYAPADWIAGLFSRQPHAYLLYALAALLVAEFLMHFKNVLRLLFVLRSVLGGVLGR